LSQNPKFFGTWQGKVIKSLVLHGKEPVSFNKLMEETEFSPKALLRALAPLRQANVIRYEGKNYFLVDEVIRQEWTKFLATNSSSDIGQKPQHAVIEAKQDIPVSSVNKEVGLVQWIIQWREMRNLNFPIESKHFFLEGEYLDELARVLIGKAQNQI